MRFHRPLCQVCVRRAGAGRPEVSGTRGTEARCCLEQECDGDLSRGHRAWTVLVRMISSQVRSPLSGSPRLTGGAGVAGRRGEGRGERRARSGAHAAVATGQAPSRCPAPGGAGLKVR